MDLLDQIKFDPEHPVKMDDLEKALRKSTANWPYGALVTLRNQAETAPDGTSLRVLFDFKRIGKIPIILFRHPRYRNQGECIFCGLKWSPDYRGPIEHSDKKRDHVADSGYCALHGDWRLVLNILNKLEWERWTNMRIEGIDTRIGFLLYTINKFMPINIFQIVRKDPVTGRTYRPKNRKKISDQTPKVIIGEIKRKQDEIDALLNTLMEIVGSHS